MGQSFSFVNHQRRRPQWRWWCQIEGVGDSGKLKACTALNHSTIADQTLELTVDLPDPDRLDRWLTA